MLRKTNLMAITGLATMLVCGQACAEPSAPKDDKKDQKVAVADTKAAPQPTAPVEQKSDADAVDMTKLSEAFGHFIGRNLNAPGVKFDLESIIKGMREGAAGKPAPMSDQDYEAMMVKVQESAFKQLAQDNLKAANDYLLKNAKEANVIEIEPGKLQYKIITEGKGAVVGEHSVPQIEYVGQYIDGTVFGSSEQSGGPISIPLDQTIPGFSKGIMNMKEGEKRRLFVHPDLGYGTSGQLPPNSLLIFDIQLLKADTAKDANPKHSNARDADLLPLALEEGLDADEDDMDDDEDEPVMPQAADDKNAAPATPVTKPASAK